MIIGVGIVLLVVGLILVTGAVDLPASWSSHIAGDTLGWILIAVGALAIVLGLIVNYQRTRVTRVERRPDYQEPVDPGYRSAPVDRGAQAPPAGSVDPAAGDDVRYGRRRM